MPDYKLIANAYPDAASDTSLTSAFRVPGDFSHYCLFFPTSMCAAANCSLQLLGGSSETGTFYTMGYSNNPATSTSGFRAWDCGADSPGKGILCEMMQFVPGYAKLRFLSTCTANTAIEVWGRLFS
jgi:hypothetical protein